MPFAAVGRPVEVRGADSRVQVLADHKVIATHPCHTRERIVIAPAHYYGESRSNVIAPPFLARMGRKLAELAALDGPGFISRPKMCPILRQSYFSRVGPVAGRDFAVRLG
jgi:hypothetical protein